MSERTITTQAVSPPFLNPLEIHGSLTYNLQAYGERAELLSFEESDNILIRSSLLPIIYRKPIVVVKDIDLEEWKKSLTYEEGQTEDLIRNILADYGIEASKENVDWLKASVDNLILFYERKNNMSLPPESRSMIHNLLIRMAYDRLFLNISQWQK